VRAAPNFTVDQRTGWLVAPNSPKELAGALREALGMAPQELSQIGDRAYDHARTNFSIARMQLATLEIYDSLLGSKLAENFTQVSQTDFSST